MLTLFKSRLSSNFVLDSNAEGEAQVLAGGTEKSPGWELREYQDSSGSCVSTR